MALIKCKECGNEVSTKAEACPKCGAKLKQKAGCGTILGVAILAVIIIGAFGSIFDSPSDGGADAKPATCGPADLQCLGDKGTIAAGVYCADQVEKLAKHSAKWTDGMLEPKFSHFRWRNQEKGEITYIGDKVQFQNGFGAFTNMIYECDMSADGKTILDVRVREGQL
jgi:hypothetical protein